MIAWNSTSKVTALPLPCMSVGVCNVRVCDRGRAKVAGWGHCETQIVFAEELRGLGRHGVQGKRGDLFSPGLRRPCVGLGGPGRSWNKSRGWLIFLFPSPFFFFFPLPFANPLGATLARQDAFFIQPPRPGSVKLHFFSAAL